MTLEFADVMCWYPYVSVKDGAIARAGGEDVIVPCETSYAAGVTCHGANLLALLGVPDLNFALIRADGKCATL
jgi:hypothetical protein